MFNTHDFTPIVEERLRTDFIKRKQLTQANEGLWQYEILDAWGALLAINDSDGYLTVVQCALAAQVAADAIIFEE
jgi:hypothetical protein